MIACSCDPADVSTVEFFLFTSTKSDQSSIQVFRVCLFLVFSMYKLMHQVGRGNGQPWKCSIRPSHGPTNSTDHLKQWTLFPALPPVV